MSLMAPRTARNPHQLAAGTAHPGAGSSPAKRQPRDLRGARLVTSAAPEGVSCREPSQTALRWSDRGAQSNDKEPRVIQQTVLRELI